MKMKCKDFLHFLCVTVLLLYINELKVLGKLVTTEIFTSGVEKERI